MKKRLKNILIFLISVISLTSCSFEDLVSIMNNKYYGTSEESGFHSDDTGNSLQLIDQAFNGKVDKNGKNLFKEFSNEEDKQVLVSAKRLKIDNNLQDLSYLDGSTPSIGKVKGLVIPVDFSDAPISDKVYENTAVSWQSVSSYYHNSSFGKLDLTFDVLPWFRLSKNSSYYHKLTEKNQNTYTGEIPGVSAIIHEVLRSAQKEYDLSQYDSDNDGLIDALHIVYSKKMEYNSDDFWWAYQYSNFEYREYDNVCPYNYVFSSFHFLFEDDETNKARTIIHETGHLFGLEDYYDYSTTEGYNKGGLGGIDMMDMTRGDHNPYSKLLLGWIDNPILVELKENSSTTIQITPSSENGDVIIIADNFDEDKGIFQSYFLIEYLNFSSMLLKDEYEGFSKDGIRVYRVNSELMTYTTTNGSYDYLKYDNSYTKFNVIDAFNKGFTDIYPQAVYSKYQCATNNDLYFKGDSEKGLHYSYTSINERVKSSYTFKVTDLTDQYALIKISR